MRSVLCAEGLELGYNDKDACCDQATRTVENELLDSSDHVDGDIIPGTQAAQRWVSRHALAQAFVDSDDPRARETADTDIAAFW